MNTDIVYLRELGEDLSEAARRSAERRVAGARAVRRSGWSTKAVAFATAAFLGLAGLIGFVATRDFGTGSAENATAPGIVKRAVGNIPAPMASASPAPAAHGVGGGASAGGTQKHASLEFYAGSTVPPIGPAIIKTGDLWVRVSKGDFEDRYSAAMLVAQKYGGYVQSSSRSGSKVKSGTLLIRVPADSFDLAFKDLSALGEAKRQSVSGRDVTAEFVDINARLRNLRAEQRRLLGFLHDAKTVRGSLEVERSLNRVELGIEQLTGQLRLLDNQTSFGTISMHLYEPRPKRRENPKPKEHGGLTFTRAWDNSVDGFLGVVYAVIVGLGYLIPLSLLALLIWLGFRWTRNRVTA